MLGLRLLQQQSSDMVVHCGRETGSRWKELNELS